MVADRKINRLERLGISVAGKKRKQRENKEKTHQKTSPTLDTLFVHGMPWHAYAVAVKSK